MSAARVRAASLWLRAALSNTIFEGADANLSGTQRSALASTGRGADRVGAAFTAISARMTGIAGCG